MENNKLQIPRFNLVQLMGIAWLTPFLLIAIIFMVNDSRIILTPFAIAVIFLVVGLGFFFKKKWVRYLVFIGLMCCLIILLVAARQLISKGNLDYYFINDFSIGCSFFTFIVGLFLLTFNIGTAIEFERLPKEPINYTKALEDAILNKSYYFKNTVNLTTCLSLILAAPFFILLFGLYKEISRNRFSFDSNDDIFLVLITFGSLMCGITTFLKFKISQYLTLVLFIFIFLFSLSEIDSYLSSKYIIIMSSLFAIGILFSFTILAMLFHPLTTYFFENTTRLVEDYDDILDLE